MSYLIQRADDSSKCVQIDVEFNLDEKFKYSIWNVYGELVYTLSGYETEKEAWHAATIVAKSLGFDVFTSEYLELL